jgi:hypothetical protein
MKLLNRTLSLPDILCAKPAAPLKPIAALCRFGPCCETAMINWLVDNGEFLAAIIAAVALIVSIHAELRVRRIASLNFPGVAAQWGEKFERHDCHQERRTPFPALPRPGPDRKGQPDRRGRWLPDCRLSPEGPRLWSVVPESSLL